MDVIAYIWSQLKYAVIESQAWNSKEETLLAFIHRHVYFAYHNRCGIENSSHHIPYYFQGFAK